MSRYKIDPYLLNEKEIDILKSLNFNSTPLLISKDTNIPRSTVYFTLDKLKKRGLVSEIKSGIKKKWVLRKESYRDSVSSKQTDSVSYYTKARDIKNIITDLIINNSFKTQNLSGDNVSAAWERNIGLEYIIKLNSYLGKNSIISDLISSRKFILNNKNKLGNEWLGSFSSKPTEYHTINDEYLDHGGQIFLLKEKIYIINMNKPLIIEISDVEIVKMIALIFSFIKDNAVRTSVSDLIK